LGPHFQHQSSPSRPHSNNISLDPHDDIPLDRLRQDDAVRAAQQCPMCVLRP
jgi:hypothetical protein